MFQVYLLFLQCQVPAIDRPPGATAMAALADTQTAKLTSARVAVGSMPTPSSDGAAAALTTALNAKLTLAWAADNSPPSDDLIDGERKAPSASRPPSRRPRARLSSVPPIRAGVMAAQTGACNSVPNIFKTEILEQNLN